MKFTLPACVVYDDTMVKQWLTNSLTGKLTQENSTCTSTQNSDVERQELRDVSQELIDSCQQSIVAHLSRVSTGQPATKTLDTLTATFEDLSRIASAAMVVEAKSKTFNYVQDLCRLDVEFLKKCGPQGLITPLCQRDAVGPYYSIDAVSATIHDQRGSAWDRVLSYSKIIPGKGHAVDLASIKLQAVVNVKGKIVIPTWGQALLNVTELVKRDASTGAFHMQRKKDSYKMLHDWLFTDSGQLRFMVNDPTVRDEQCSVVSLEAIPTPFELTCLLQAIIQLFPMILGSRGQRLGVRSIFMASLVQSFADQFLIVPIQSWLTQSGFEHFTPWGGPVEIERSLQRFYSAITAQVQKHSVPYELVPIDLDIKKMDYHVRKEGVATVAALFSCLVDTEYTAVLLEFLQLGCCSALLIPATGIKGSITFVPPQEHSYFSGVGSTQLTETGFQFLIDCDIESQLDVRTSIDTVQPIFTVTHLLGDDYRKIIAVPKGTEVYFGRAAVKHHAHINQRQYLLKQFRRAYAGYGLPLNLAKCSVCDSVSTFCRKTTSVQRLYSNVQQTDIKAVYSLQLACNAIAYPESWPATNSRAQELVRVAQILDETANHPRWNVFSQELFRLLGTNQIPGQGTITEADLIQACSDLRISASYMKSLGFMYTEFGELRELSDSPTLTQWREILKRLSF